nr:hypothetical protein [Fusobacterium gastrosuis]
MDKTIIKELFNSSVPKEYYKKNKDKFKNVEIFSFEENDKDNKKLNLEIFSLPVSNDKIKVTKFTNYEQLDIFNKEILLNLRYVIELDTNVVSYLKSFYDRNLKDNELIKAVESLIKDLDGKRENFLLGNNLYIWENLIKGEKEDILLDNIKKAECVLNYKFYKTKDNIEEKTYLNQINEIKNLKEDILKRYYIIYSLLLKSFYLKLKKLSLKDKLKRLIDFINNQLCCYMEEEILLCTMYLFDNDEVTKFFKQKKVESMTWDLLHLRLLKERISLNSKNEMLNFPLILSSDNAFNEIMMINPVRAVVYDKELSKITIINKKDIFSYIYDSDKISDSFKNEILSELYNGEKNRKNKINYINFKELSENLEKELENLKSIQIKKGEEDL